MDKKSLTEADTLGFARTLCRNAIDAANIRE
jgi:hypothetical protein